jgi:hypothetical protein
MKAAFAPSSAMESSERMRPPLKFVADIRHVCEVSLLGAADLGYWRDHLAAQGLRPAERAGRAQLLIVAAEMRFMGVWFRELSFSVLVTGPDAGGLSLTPALSPEGRGSTTASPTPVPERTTAAGAYLVQAFNSCRFFAFCERAFFSTPYSHGDVRVVTDLPASIRLRQTGETIVAAEMAVVSAAGEREPARVGEDGWQGPVYLPARGRAKNAAGKWFFAEISGQTRTYPFEPSVDSLAIVPGCDGGILQALVDSQFIATQWAIRDDARHAKSKTYPRSETFHR